MSAGYKFEGISATTMFGSLYPITADTSSLRHEVFIIGLGARGEGGGVPRISA